LQNIGLLGEALGIEIEVQSEVGVGAFAVDLAGKELSSGRPLIVENQLAPTDHGHLGQLLTYAAGLDAAVVIWIAPSFREEHRQAIDWLNQHTDEQLDFFGIEIELLKIDASPPAPHFKLVAQPNEWAKTTKQAAAGGGTERGNQYRRFFEVALPRFEAVRPGMTSASRVGPRNWFSFSAGRSGFVHVWSFYQGERFRAELYIDTGDRARNKAAFDQLALRSDELTAAVGMPLAWERLEAKRASRISVSYPGPLVDVVDQDEALQTWAVDTMVRMCDVFRPIVRSLAV